MNEVDEDRVRNILLLLLFTTVIRKVTREVMGMLRVFLWLQRRRVRVIAAVVLDRLEQSRAIGNMHRSRRRAWVWPRRQFIFEDLLARRLPDNFWRENFRVTQETFFKICEVVLPELAKQDTAMRRAIPVEKRVAIALNRLASGDSFRTSGMNFGHPKSTANVIKNEFCELLKIIAPSSSSSLRVNAKCKRQLMGFKSFLRFHKWLVL